MRVFSQLSTRFEVVGVLDVDARAAHAVSEEWHVARLTSERDALDRADAVIVATPIGAHAATVRRALAAGRHVLVEKPIAGSIQDARTLLALAESARRHLFVGHSERFNPVIRALARLVDPKDVLAIEIRRVGATASRAHEHGALLNLGVHDLDLMAYLTRSPLALRHAMGGADAAGDMAHVLVGTASGAAGHIYVDQRSATRQRTIALTTRARIFHGNLLTPSLVCTCRGTGLRESIALGSEEPLAMQALAFAAALDGEATPQIATGLDCARALLAAERAAARMVAVGASVPAEKL
jgi:predicted dehydrogenase